MLKEVMRRLTHMRMAAVVLLAAGVTPTGLCFGAVTSSPHPCCRKQESAWHDGRGAHEECCFVSAPAPNQEAVVTATHPGWKAAPAVIACAPLAVAAEQALAAVATSEHSPPGLTSRTILRI